MPKLTYAYKEGENDTGLIQSLTESTGNTTSYVYDKLNRLTEAKTAGTNPSFYKYTLDGAGNRTKQVVNLTKDEETGGKTTYYVTNAANELECRQTVTGACSKNSSTELSGLHLRQSRGRARNRPQERHQRHDVRLQCCERDVKPHPFRQRRAQRCPTEARARTT